MQQGLLSAKSTPRVGANPDRNRDSTNVKRERPETSCLDGRMGRRSNEVHGA